MALMIDVISDVVCPWCYIGKRHLEEALVLYANENPEAPLPEVRWRAFEMNPSLPEEGMDRAEYFRAKFGPEDGEAIASVEGAGRAAGIVFAFSRVSRQPNTRAAHALIARSPSAAVQEELVERLFRAFFVEGLDLSQPKNLETIALRAGLDGEAIRAVLERGDGFDRVAAEEDAAREIGVEGVPVFIFNRRYAVSGVRSAEVLLDAMRRAASEEQPS